MKTTLEQLLLPMPSAAFQALPPQCPPVPLYQLEKKLCQTTCRGGDGDVASHIVLGQETIYGADPERWVSSRKALPSYMSRCNYVASASLLGMQEERGREPVPWDGRSGTWSMNTAQGLHPSLGTRLACDRRGQLGQVAQEKVLE